MRFLFATALLACAACSSQNTVSSSACATDPRVESFNIPLSSKGSTGANIVIENATPTLVQQGLNEWTVSIKDSSGTPIDGTVTVLSSMPDHGHNSPTNPTITAKGNGEYDIAGVNLSMIGVWTVTISIASPTVNDDVTFTFCVDGT